MKVHNLRLGHATNSSSSHSIVIAPANYENLPGTDHMAQSGYTYGWEHFILADPQSKAEYFAAQLFTSMVNEGITDQIAAASIRDWLDVDFGGEINHKYPDIGVDHQSSIDLPISTLSKRFMDDLLKFIGNERVVIYGGNDNDGWMDIPNGFSNIPFLDALTDSRDKKKLKSDGKYWIIYDYRTGNKIRFSFDFDNMDAEDYIKASTPELVDVKITDYCPFGCEFCYQASTKDGLHAGLDEVRRLIGYLGELEVFEVALGGGEPTMHPKFAEILKNCHENKIRPNFTTFSKKWLNDKNIVHAVKEYCGGIGVSVHNVKDLDKVADIAEVINGGRDNFGGSGWINSNTQIMAQHVLGAHDLDDSLMLIKESWDRRIPVLLLGYKDVGFGAEFGRHDTEGIEVALKLLLDDVNRRRYATLSVDTAVLDQYPQLCEVLGVSKALTSSPEGKFSMYIDLVNEKMAKSSYVKPEEYVDLYGDSGWDGKAEHIKKQFARW